MYVYFLEYACAYHLCVCIAVTGATREFLNSLEATTAALGATTAATGITLTFSNIT